MANNIYSNETIGIDVQPLTLLSILVEEPKLTNEEDLFTTLEWFINDNITRDELDNYMDICKKYMLDNNPKLKVFNEAIQNIDNNLKTDLLGDIYAIFDNNHELLLIQSLIFINIKMKI